MANIENIANVGINLFITDVKNPLPNVKGATANIDALAKSQASARYAGMNFNRVIQDSPFFFQNFNMGVMSVANNIAPLAESFAMAKQNGAGLAMVLKGMFTGVGGWLTAINLIVAGIQAVSFWMADNKREAKSAKEEQDAYLTKLKEVAQFRNTGGVSFTRAQVETALYRATKERADLEGAIRLKQTSDTTYLLKQNEIYEKTNGERGYAISLESKKLMLGQATIEQYKARIEEINKERAFLSENLDKLKEKEKLVGRLVSLGGSASGEEKKVTEELGKQLKIKSEIAKIRDFVPELNLKIKISEADIEREKKRFQEKLNTGGQLLNTPLRLEAPAKPEDYGEALEKPGVNLDYGKAFSTSFASTFESSVSSVWKDIFGEANSVGEMFISSFVNSLISQLSGQLATLITNANGSGGSGSSGIIGTIVGVFESLFSTRSDEGRPLMATGQNININVDGKTFMKAVYEPNYKKSANNMIRTRQL